MESALSRSQKSLGTSTQSEGVQKTNNANTLLEAIEAGNLKLAQKFIREGADVHAKNSAGSSVSEIAPEGPVRAYLAERIQRESKTDMVLATQISELEKQFPNDPQELKHLLSLSLVYQKVSEERAKNAIRMVLQEKYFVIQGWKSYQSQFNEVASLQGNCISDLKSQIRELQEIAAEQQSFFSQLLESDKDSKGVAKKSEGQGESSKEGGKKEDIILTKNDNGQMTVKSATIEKLIERLLDPLVHDNHFTQTLLLNHKSICESQQLLNWIAANFKLNTKETLPQLLKSINIMKYWIEQFWSDFQADEQLMTNLSNAIATIENAKLATTLRNLLAKKVNALNEVSQVADTGDLPKPILPKHLILKRGNNASSMNSSQKGGIDNLRPPGSNYGRDPNASFATSAGTQSNSFQNSSFNATSSFSGGSSSSSSQEDGGRLRLMDIDPLEAARQLTLIEYELFSKVRPREFTGLAWMKDDKEVRAPNITKMVRWSNHVIKWLVTEIVSMKDNVKTRAAMMEKIVMMAKHCDSLNNFNAVKEIMAALQSSSVGRLKKTKDAMSAKHVKLMEDLMTLTSNEMNFKNLRTKIHSVEPPMIPFPGVYQGDLVFLESYGKDIQDGMVNFMKFQKVTTYVVELQTYQQAQFKLLPVPEIQDMIKEYIGLEEEPAYAFSLICEPRNQA